MSGWRGDKNREGQEMRGMKRREGREFEGGNEGRTQDERENLRKFFFIFFFIPTRRDRTCFISLTKNKKKKNKG